VTPWFEAGLYLPLYSRDKDAGWGLDGFKLRALFAVPKADERTFFYGRLPPSRLASSVGLPAPPPMENCRSSRMETGQEVLTARDTLTNGTDGKKWDIYAYTRQIPLQNVAPGRVSPARGRADTRQHER
jgi:hypothetical protein